jgi:hypothetical protein
MVWVPVVSLAHVGSVQDILSRALTETDTPNDIIRQLHPNLTLNLMFNPLSQLSKESTYLHAVSDRTLQYETYENTQ